MCDWEKKNCREKNSKMLFIFTSEHTLLSTSLISIDSVLEFQAHVWWHHRWWYANLWLNRAVPKTCRMPGKQREEIINCSRAKLLMQNSKVFIFFFLPVLNPFSQVQRQIHRCQSLQLHLHDLQILFRLVYVYIHGHPD